jgi:hypothetical protein
VQVKGDTGRFKWLSTETAVARAQYVNYYFLSLNRGVGTEEVFNRCSLIDKLLPYKAWTCGSSSKEFCLNEQNLPGAVGGMWQSSVWLKEMR